MQPTKPWGGTGTEASRADLLGERPVVMVVDDDPDLLILVQQVLKKQVSWSKTRSQPPDREDLSNTAPVMVFLDVGLGSADGGAVCSAIRSNLSFAHIPLVLISGLGEERLRDAPRNCGAEGFPQ